MTRLYVLGSGSKGNCFGVEEAGAIVLVDAGFGPKETERRAQAVGLDLSRVVGIVLSHEHGDHAGGALQLARRLKVPILASNGTWTALPLDKELPTHISIGFASTREIGPFTISAGRSNHDAAEPVAIVVETLRGGRIGFAMDLGRSTGAVRYLFRELHAVVVEANYDEVMLRTGNYPASVQHRIAGSGGHLSNGEAAEFLVGIHHVGLSHVVLAHLSQQCNSPECALAWIEPALARVGFRGVIAIAPQDEALAPISIAVESGRDQEELPLRPAEAWADPLGLT